MNMKAPFISIIVPIYNVEAYLKDCVDSLLSQTYPHLEIILVDDGSPDNCPAICDKVANGDHRVRVIHKANGGVSSARNAGLDLCRGDYILFVDGDDRIAPEACELLLAQLLSTGADLCVGGMCYIDEAGTLAPEPTPLDTGVTDRQEAFRRSTEALDIYFTVLCGKLYKRALFDGLRMPEGRIHEDTYLVHRVFGRCDRIATVGKPLYLYRRRPNSIMSAPYHIKRLEDGAWAHLDRYLYLQERGYDRWARFALQNLCSVVNVGLRKLPVKGNEAVFYPYIQYLLRHYRGLRCTQMVLLLAKNYLTMKP